MTSDLDSPRRSAGDRERARAYHREFWPAIAAYLLLVAVAPVLAHVAGVGPWRYVWVVLPVLPTLWIIRAVVRHLRRVDDYQRLLLLQGLAVGFACAMVAALVVGFLDIGDAAVRGGGWIVYVAGMLGWAVTAGVTQRR